MPRESEKIISLSDFDKLRRSFADRKKVLVGGCFDVLHYGHMRFLSAAADCADLLLVALEPDEFIRKNKKREPVHNQEQRAEILASLQMVDLVIKLPYLSKDSEYFEMVSTISPQIIASTEGDPQEGNKKKQAEHVGGQFKFVTHQIGDFSSSKILS